MMPAASLLENKTILVTGSAGFLAKVFVEKVLRIQPYVKKIYLLMRAPDSHSAAKRLRDEVMEKELFRVVKEKWGTDFEKFVSEKVVAVAGDVSREDLGIGDVDLKEGIWRETDLVVNFAATTRFDERYDVALATNTYGAAHVVKFSKKCVKIKLLVHVSTAYVCGEEAGIIKEKPVSMAKGGIGDDDDEMIFEIVDGERKLVQQTLLQLQSNKHLSSDCGDERGISSAMRLLGLERARHYGWPNTYTFTKAMGERIAMSLKGDLPLVILRPAIVTSTIKHPFPGWTEGVRTIDGFIVNYAKGRMKCLIERPETVYDLIPVDMVVNSIVGCICSAFQNQPLDLIYHLGSSRNPITSSDLRHCMFTFFSRNQWKDRHGRTLKASKWKTFSSFKTFQIYMTIRFLIPLKVLCLVNAALCHRFEAMCGDLDRKLKMAMRLVKLYEPYLLFVGIFDDTNLERLRARGRQNGWWGVEEMNMNAGSINWSDYIMNVHIPGLIRFVKF
ncbi:unnamed protein product [Linum trigynum]|uniref:Fatty acyl-CoA reductase n=1 Tax=Linum trigynum TaxID=586398 RepID=A0AAV2GEA5_9ROSI